MVSMYFHYSISSIGIISLVRHFRGSISDDDSDEELK
jgi:hypothetical protein